MRDDPAVHVVHDYLTQRGGAERVAWRLAAHFGGRLTTSLYSPRSTFDELRDIEVHELLPWLPSRLRASPLLMSPMVALAFLLARVEGDVVLCSSSGWSHWVRTSGKKIVYCYTPARWLWAADDYFAGRRLLREALRLPLALLRTIDRRMVSRTHGHIAISQVSADRIWQAYGRKAVVIPPPVTLTADGPQTAVPGVEGPYFLTIGRARAYKNTAVVEDAFRNTEHGRLVVVGGPPRDSWGTQDAPSNVTRLGRVTDEELRWLYANCVATIGLSREDFGLTPVEGHLFGKPAIVLASGGYLETCIDGVNAVLVPQASASSLLDGLSRFTSLTFDREVVRATAAPYAPGVFLDSLDRFLRRAAA